MTTIDEAVAQLKAMAKDKAVFQLTSEEYKLLSESLWAHNDFLREQSRTPGLPTSITKVMTDRTAAITRLMTKLESQKPMP
jgi:hypothetical protein